MNDRAEIEAVVRAEAERLGYRQGEFMDDHMAIALAVLDRVGDVRRDDEAAISDDGAAWRCPDCQCVNAMHEAFCFRCGAGQPEFSARSPHGEDHEAAELREKIADALAENDQCGVGPLSRQEYLDDAEAILSLIRAYGDDEGLTADKAYDDDAATTYQDALAAACGTEADPPGRSPQGEDDQVLVNDERTVLVNIWSTGEVEVAFRADRSAVWGPPVRVVEDA